MAKSLQLKYAIWTYLLMTWSAMAYAAESPFVAGIEAIPEKAIAYVIGLALIGGAAGTLTKLSRPDTVVRNLSLEIAKDALTSVVAGLLAFFFTSWSSGISFWPQAILITVAGYGGSKVLDMALAEGFIPWFQRMLGKTQDKNGSP